MKVWNKLSNYFDQNYGKHGSYIEFFTRIRNALESTVMIIEIKASDFYDVRAMLLPQHKCTP